MKLFTIAIVSLMITALYGQTAVENSGLTNITLPSPILPDIDSISFNASRLKTAATKEDKQVLSDFRAGIAVLDRVMASMKINITNLRFVQLVSVNNELINLIKQGAPRDQIVEARRRVQAVRTELRALANIRHRLCLLKWGIKDCMRTFMQIFITDDFLSCGRQCFRNITIPETYYAGNILNELRQMS